MHTFYLHFTTSKSDELTVNTKPPSQGNKYITKTQQKTTGCSKTTSKLNLLIHCRQLKVKGQLQQADVSKRHLDVNHRKRCYICYASNRILHTTQPAGAQRHLLFMSANTARLVTLCGHKNIL